MNTYQISVDHPQAQVKAWLQANACPKAAASIKAGAGFQTTFTIDGNLTAITILEAFKRAGLKHKCVPLNGSSSLPQVL